MKYKASEIHPNLKISRKCKCQFCHFEVCLTHRHSELQNCFNHFYNFLEIFGKFSETFLVNLKKI